MKDMDLFDSGTLVAMTAAALLAGCAHARPPQDLKNAEVAYEQASTSPGAARAHADVVEAKRALDHAEQEFHDTGDSRATRDWSYIAVRKAGSARARANAIAALEQERQAKSELNALLEAQKTELRQARTEVRDQAEETREALAKIAGMSQKESSRGTVLTLSGSVLFASGKSALLPEARERLDQVAQALAKDPRPLLIEGFTDSTGSDALNMRLSKERADAVRAYLASHGVDPGRVTAEGMGKADPIATNKTPEGRANNRRVEITLENAPSTKTSSPNGR